MDRKNHWDHIYETKSSVQVSWYERHLDRSMGYITELCPKSDCRVIDIGGGTSTLVDDLLDAGFTNISIVDVSPAALSQARARLGDRSDSVAWIEGDVTGMKLEPGSYDIWHDRAVFHFLTEGEDRAAYIALAEKAIKVGGYLIVATFAEDGPEKCSGLEVSRYSIAALAQQFAKAFRLVKGEKEEHITPGGAVQKFTYGVFQKK